MRAPISPTFSITTPTRRTLLWVDADIGFHSGDVAKLVALQTEFAAATYPKKTLPLRYSCALPTEGIVWNKSHTAIQAAYVGSGFQLLSRSVFERIAKKFPELKYSPRSESRAITPKEAAGSFHYYDTYTDKNGMLVGEDYAFCQRFRKAGGRDLAEAGRGAKPCRELCVYRRQFARYTGASARPP